MWFCFFWIKLGNRMSKIEILIFWELFQMFARLIGGLWYTALHPDVWVKKANLFDPKDRQCVNVVGFIFRCCQTSCLDSSSDVVKQLTASVTQLINVLCGEHCKKRKDLIWFDSNKTQFGWLTYPYTRSLSLPIVTKPAIH